ncbi:ATP synthase F0 subcomplex B subunit [Arenibacter nanhaiticus]|uniref:ATP synthase subunit b n=1 Tax=Arenibacter nanhaiticus TaxID=558155 RepID=A0A1M6A6U2_9FLAO|nr:F0F1 ATP synthase subunit B [Arenibacter nanhaiticus]SHI31863.1 ATP synthase F0 subcomplex B subunit [Arenibacter nanhaiticus]
MDQLLNDFSPGLFTMQLVILLVLIFLMAKFAWRPILDALNEREEGISEALAAAEEARKEMQNLQADNEKMIKEARAEREAMIREAREMKEKIIADAKETAQFEGDKMIKQAQLAIEAEKKAAFAELKSEVASISLGIAEKMIKGQLSTENKQLELVEELMADIKLN